MTARKLILAAVAALLAFAALLAIMFLSQASLLFPTNLVAAAGPTPPGAERWQLKLAGGDEIHGVHIPPAVENGPRTLILGFGGNAWNGQHVAEYLAEVFPEAHVVAFHYRGYRPSSGSPSAKALMDDAPLFFDEAKARIRPDRIVLAGFSIGSGVAASLSRERTVDGLILVTPFDSLKSVAADLYPWLPIGPFFQHEIATADYLREVEAPVAILAAERDEIVGSARTAALRRGVPNLAYDRTISAAGHNDLYQRNEFRAGLREALKTIVAAQK